MATIRYTLLESCIYMYMHALEYAHGVGRRAGRVHAYMYLARYMYNITGTYTSTAVHVLYKYIHVHV